MNTVTHCGTCQRSTAGEITWPGESGREICQDCWEAETSRSWWQLVNAMQPPPTIWPWAPQTILTLWVASARAAARWSSDAYDPAHIHAGHVTDGPRLTVNGNHFANTGKMV